jgi:tetratricopeptide (TPR) repeat protein
LLDERLVVLPSTTCNPFQGFAKPSDSKDWLAAGKQLMLHEEFEEARAAFNRAGDPHMAAVATACHLRQVAFNTLDAQQRRRAFSNSATEFERCAMKSESLEERYDQYAAAAECYARAQDHQKAARLFELAQKFTVAALHCLSNGLLDRAVTIIRKYSTHVDQEIIERIQQAARFKYLQEKRLE